MSLARYSKRIEAAEAAVAARTAQTRLTRQNRPRGFWLCSPATCALISHRIIST